MRHFSKLMLILSSSIISFTSCYESALDKPAEKLSGNKVHAQMYVSLNYDDAVFAGDANVSNRRFIVEARDAENTENVVERKEIVYNTASTVTEGFERIPVVFELDQKKYVVSVWMDYIETGTDKDFYYNTEDLSKISMITPESAADVHRDALASTQTIDLTEQALGAEFAVNAQLLSRVAKWSLIANDWRNLFAKKGEAAKTAIINVAYTSGIAKGFNLYTASTGDIREGIAFEAPINVPVSEKDTKITLAEDYFFISQNEETVGLNVIVKSATGEEWHTTENVSLTCNAGKESKSESNYLTGEDEIIKDPAKFEGEGTEESPYLINDAEDLKTLMELINNGENQDYPYQTSYYKQNNDIDATGIQGLHIGTEENPFKGNYNGNYKSIKNLDVQPIDNKQKNPALFSVIENATISCLKLENASNNNSQKSINNAGILVALAKGNSHIEDIECKIATLGTKSTVTGAICAKLSESSSLDIKGCKVVDYTTDNGVIKTLINETDICYIGSIIGYAGRTSNLTIEDSYAKIKVTNTTIKGEKARDENIKDKIGGLCGYSDGTYKINRCYYVGKVGTTKNVYAEIGSLIGKETPNGEIENSFHNATIQKASSFGTEVNNNNSIQFAAEAWPNWDINGSTAWGNMGEYNADSSTYPTLKWEN